jgi:hypothetical protein
LGDVDAGAGQAGAADDAAGVVGAQPRGEARGLGGFAEPAGEVAGVRAALVALLIPGSAFAQEYLGDDLIDFERLLRENADRVVETTTMAGDPARTVDLGDGQKITCSDMGCDGDGPNAGLGCEWEWLTIARGTALACSAPASPGLTALEEIHHRMSAHVARNAYPPREAGEVEGRYQRVIDAIMAWPKDEIAASCAEGLSPNGMIRATISAMSEPETVAAIESRLHSAGLPFVGHCY